MKVIELKKEKMQDDVYFDYAEMIQAVVASPLNPQQGADINEMRSSIRVLDALEGLKAGDTLELKDTDYNHLKLKVEAFKWRQVHKVIVQFVEDIVNAAEKEK